MFALKTIAAGDKAGLYAELLAQVRGLLHGEHDLVANAANFAALLYLNLPDVNWVGFYFLKDKDLVVGPFQGKPACVRIALGKGVCGIAATQRRSLVVADVYKFPGHIFCDGASRSEAVVPLLRNDALLGVLDLDSPHPGRFDAEDQAGLEQLSAAFLDSL